MVKLLTYVVPLWSEQSLNVEKRDMLIALSISYLSMCAESFLTHLNATEPKSATNAR